jgi:hypothetical protein
MNVPPVSPFLHAANLHLADESVTLEEAVAAFAALKDEDKRKQFGQLCLRRHQVSDHLINLLFAISARLPCQRPTTLRFLAERWQTRDKDPHLAARMLTMIIEQFAA